MQYLESKLSRLNLHRSILFRGLSQTFKVMLSWWGWTTAVPRLTHVSKQAKPLRLQHVQLAISSRWRLRRRCCNGRGCVRCLLCLPFAASLIITHGHVCLQGMNRGLRLFLRQWHPLSGCHACYTALDPLTRPQGCISHALSNACHRMKRFQGLSADWGSDRSMPTTWVARPFV